MIRLTANISKKIPVDGIDFSCRQAGASVEIELASGDDQTITQRLQDLYAVLDKAVEQQLANGSNGHPIQADEPAHAPTNGNGPQPARKLSDAQRKCIYAISMACGINGDMATYLQPFGVDSSDDLTVKQASELIDTLKALPQPANNGNGQ
jgi:hypothetical protein